MNSLVVNYSLNHIKHEWVVPNTDPYRKRELLMTIAYISVQYGYYLQGLRWVLGLTLGSMIGGNHM